MKTRNFVKHLPHYVPIIGIMIIGIWGFYSFSYDKQFQIALALGMAVSYFSWGIVHHVLHKDLSLEAVFEYFFIALLGVITLISVIFRT